MDTLMLAVLAVTLCCTMVSAYHDAHHRYISCVLILVHEPCLFFSPITVLLVLCYTRLRTVPWCAVPIVSVVLPICIPLIPLSQVSRLPRPPRRARLSRCPPPIPSGLARGGWDALVAVAASRGIGKGRAQPTVFLTAPVPPHTAPAKWPRV